LFVNCSRHVKLVKVSVKCPIKEKVNLISELVIYALLEQYDTYYI